MASRNINTIKWKNVSGDIFSSYEVWSLRPISDIDNACVIYGRDKLSGISVDGFLWVKSLEVYPPGEGWNEVS